MFTDIEGYTALMQKSEETAFLFRDTHRRIFRDNTERYHGEVNQYYGDGTLSIFDSAVDAVQCGIAMQLAFQQEPRIPVRIGIHSGDVVLSDEDIIGDGVNVASRIESLAVPGSVFISDKVYDEIKNSDAIETSFLDTFRLKNVDHPIGVYAISNEGLVVPPRKAISGKLEKEPPAGRRLIPLVIAVLLLGMVAFWGYRSFFSGPGGADKIESILVLPFDNFSGQDELDYFIAGMHSSLIGELGRISALRVISPTTARAYAGTQKSLAEIAEEHNVDAFLEVAVLGLGDSVHLQPKLIRVYPEEQQLWVQDYQEAKSQILNLYNSITQKVSQLAGVSLTAGEAQRIAENRTVDTAAYDLYQKGQFYLDQISPASLEKAFQYFKLAAEIDPDWAPPYAGLANVIQYRNQMGFLTPSEAIPQIHNYLDKALELDPNSAEAYYQRAVTAVWIEWDWEKGEAAFRKSLELEPNNASCHMFYAHLLMILRQNEKALQHAKQARDLDALRPFILGLYSVVLLYAADDPAAALVQAEKVFALEPDHYFTKAQLEGIWIGLGEYEKVFELWKEGNYAFWQEHGFGSQLEDVFRKHGWVEFTKELIKANEEIWEKEDHPHPMAFARKCVETKDFDKAVAYLEIDYERHDPNLPYLSTSLYYDKMKANSRYIALLKKMNLPVD